MNQKKLLAGILGILLGTFGVHKFILGYNQEGIIMLVSAIVLALLTTFICMPGLGMGLVWAVGLIEGIVYLTKSDSEFEATYIKAKRAWF